MTECSLTIILYWGGHYAKTGDYFYDGGSSKILWLNESNDFDDLLNMVYEAIGCDRMSINVKLNMRYICGEDYWLVPLKDAEALSGMWMIVSSLKLDMMELYVDQVTKVHSSSVSGILGSFTSMLCDPNYVLDHYHELTTPVASPSNEYSHYAHSTSQVSFALLNHVDHLFNINDDNVDSDAEEDEEAREEADRVIMEGCPSRDWLRINMADQRQIDAWMMNQTNTSFTPNCEFEVGQEFDSLSQLKNIVKSWSISKNHNFKVVESEPSKYVIKCVNDECPWRMRAILTRYSAFKIVKYAGPHASTCVGKLSNGADHPLLSSDFVAELIEEFIRDDPAFKISSIVIFVKDKCHFVITYKRAWMAKQKALTNVFGDWKESYAELPRYLEAIKDSNKGFVFQLCLAETQQINTKLFQRVFWAFRPSIKGFVHCRPLITIDGTHLYGKYKGTLLIAMGTDANFQLFPLAFLDLHFLSSCEFP